MQAEVTINHQRQSPSPDDLLDAHNFEQEELLEAVKTVPAVPKEAHKFGTIIEQVKLCLALITKHLGCLKEEVAVLRADHAKAVRGEKATLNDKDKAEVDERRCSADPMIQQREARISLLSDAFTRWDARRSRLHRDFEIARIDYEHRKRLQQIDYEANRRRHSS